MAHDIELAVERGRDADGDASDMVGLDVVLNRLTNQVSSRSHDGGTLHQVQSFNAFLERAARILEGSHA